MNLRNNVFTTLVLFLSLLFTSCRVLMDKEIKQLEKAKIFSVSENNQRIVLDGVINSSAYAKFKTLAELNPHIKTLDIVNCEGSINDEINLKLAKYIHNMGFNTHLQDNGMIASGGTDLFLSGHKRTKGDNTRIGVHSWAGNKKVATDFPKGHKYHQPYIDYYVSVGFSKQQAELFYYFTIHSAPAEDIHWMTDLEITKYNMLTL